MTVLGAIEKKEDPPEEDEEESSGSVFDQTPVRVACPHCGLHVITFIEHEASWVTYVVSIVLLFTLGWAALCVVPVVFPLLKDVVHHCPRCLNVLASRSRVAITNFKGEVMTFRFGSCVVVLARKYVILLAGIATVIATIHLVRTSGSQAGPAAAATAALTEPGKFSELAWQDFVKDCGFKSYLGNPIHVTTAFDEKFRNRSFKWEGRLRHTEDAWHFWWYHQRGLLFVRMDPPQFPNTPRHSDLVLTFEDTYEAGRTAMTLKPGAVFGFRATMVEVGRRGAPHTMVLHEIFSATEKPPGAAEGSAELAAGQNLSAVGGA